MINQNEWSYCPTRMKCGVCRETGKLCPHIDTAANQRTEDKLATTPPPKVQHNELWGWVPEACRTCSSHPMNGGSGLCSCSLAYPDVGSLTATLTSTSMSVKNDGSSSSSVTIDNSNIPRTYTTATTSGNTLSTLEDK